jgi:PAS domain S-box-containing protein
MNTINYKSIRTSLVLLVLLIFIPLFAIVFHSAHEYRLSAKRFASENALRVARNLAEQQKLIERSTRQFLELLSQLPEIKSGDTNTISQLFSLLLKQNHSYASLLLVNIQGDVIAASQPFDNVNVSDRKYFQDVLQSRTFSIGEYTHSRLCHKAVLHYAYPVKQRDSRIQSVIIVSFDLKYYNEVFESSNAGSNAVFTFTDHRGIILYQSASLGDFSGLPECRNVFDKVRGPQAESTFIALGSDKVERLYGYEVLTLGNDRPYMYVYVGVPEKIAYAELRKILSLNVVIWIIGALFVILSAFFFCLKFIINPIDKIVKTAGLIAEGNLETRTGISNPKTELGMLAKAIDEMTDRLYHREVEQKKTQKDLRKLKERFEFAINAAHIGIWDWHIQNNILLWDKNMFELYGLDKDAFECTYENWMQLIHPDDLIYLMAEIQNAIEYHHPFRSEFRINQATHEVKYVRIFANVIDDKEGKPVRLIGVNWDMTDRKALERKLNEARERAETSDRLKSAFLANVSHEIRTPLHGIIGFAQILKENDISEQERLQYLDIILGSGNRLMTIVSNIIDISMLEAGQLKILASVCNIQDLVKDIYGFYHQLREKENKEFSFRLESDIDDSLSLTLDDFRFRQIFTQLLDNAFKFTERGEVVIGCRIFNHELLCYVKDTGIGVNSEDLIKIFDRFKQVDDSSNRHYSGNGLGLAICKGLLDLMGGRIWAVSKETGSEFYFSLSLDTIQNAQSVTSSSSGNSLFA